MTIYSLDVLLLFGTSLFFHVQFYLLFPDLHTDFSRGRSGGLVFPSLLEFSTVYCNPHSQRLWHSPLEKGMANHFRILALRTPWTVWKGKKIGHRGELPRSVGTQYATGYQWKNNYRTNAGMGPKQKQHPVVDVTGDRSKVQCCKEQYCIRTWNVRSMNQGKLEVIK